MTTPPLGSFGIWHVGRTIDVSLASHLDRLGFGALWVSSAPADLRLMEALLDATETLTIATGIVNIFSGEADELVAAWHRVNDRHPDRLLLGIGVGHPERVGTDASRPLEALVRYLDVLDAGEVPRDRLVLAALGPKVLRLAGERTAGAHPYFVTPEHTRQARAVLGARRLARRRSRRRTRLDADLPGADELPAQPHAARILRRRARLRTRSPRRRPRGVG